MGERGLCVPALGVEGSTQQRERQSAGGQGGGEAEAREKGSQGWAGQGLVGVWAACPGWYLVRPCLPRILQRGPINHYSIVICSQGGLISQLAPPLLPWQQQRCQATATPAAAAAAEQGWLCTAQVPSSLITSLPVLAGAQSLGPGTTPARPLAAPLLSAPLGPCPPHGLAPTLQTPNPWRTSLNSQALAQAPLAPSWPPGSALPPTGLPWI